MKTTQSLFGAVGETIRRVGWLPLLVFAAHEICAHVINGYERWPSVDIPLHILGGIAIAYFASGMLDTFARYSLISTLDSICHIAMIFTTACTAAVFWEFAEWISDHTIGTTCQMNDLNDTMLDLAMGVAGGISFAVALGVKMVRGGRRRCGLIDAADGC